MAKRHYIDSENPDVVLWGMTWRGIVLGGLALALCAGGSIAVWKFRVETSDIKGAGDAKIEINSGKNRIAAQEKFVTLYNSIQKGERDIQVLADTLKRNPNEYNQTNYDGAVMICNAAVADYNAAAEQAHTENWRPENLPSQIDTNDPRFDCKENSK